MKRTRLVLAGALGCVLAVGLTPTAWASTTYPAEQSNNTSTCVAGSSTSPADCAAAFAGQTDTRTGIETPLFDPPGGNVSAENVRDLLYPGSATKVFVNMMLGFCTPADGTSSPGIPRCNSNVLTQYTSDNTATVDAHLADFVRRGIDGAVMDWYGPGGRVNDATLKYQAEIRDRGYCPGGPQQCQVMYLIMYDGSTLKYPVSWTGIPNTTGSGCSTSLGGTDTENCIVARLRNDICYMNGLHFGNDAYQKYNGRPMLQFFINEGGMYPNLPKTGPAPSWEDVWFWIRQWTDNMQVNCSGAPAGSPNYAADNGMPLLLFENAGGFTHARSDGAFDWVNPTQNQDDLRISPASTGGTVDNFYATSLNYLSSKVVWGVAYKGFNDVQSAWGANRLIDQRCGQTWVLSLASARNNGYSSSRQLPFVQIATWNDYNEGTPIETGIDNCYQVAASVSGSTLTWQANAANGNANPATISHWLVFDSTDGGSSYQQIASLAAGSTSYDLSGLPAGTHTLFVKMVGRADILNQVSGTVTYASSGPPPSSWIDEQVQFLANHQLPDGALLGPGNSINPYFANLAAVGLARADTATGNTVLYKWMQWYLNHLNSTDSKGLSDTIYDYNYDPTTGAESSTGHYDSVDSYASTALNVAYTGYLTGDSRIQALVANNIGTYEAIANLDDYRAPSGVRDTDNLTMAVPGGAKYTMDNSEVAGGLADFAQLEAALGRTDQHNYYLAWHDATVSAITEKLWNTTKNTWDWALGSASDLTGTFYPNATAQLWPTLFGVVPPDSTDATSAWKAFTDRWTDWFDDKIVDSYPWTAMARAGQLNGKPDQASHLLSTLHDTYAPDWGGNWYDDEAGWFILGAKGMDP